MPVDTKEAIVRVFMELLFEKKNGKITITELVRKCGITRKTFYYHFSDIYDLAEYVIDKEISNVFDKCMAAGSLREIMEIFYDFLLGLRPAVEKGVRAGFHPLIVELLSVKLYGLFVRLAERKYVHGHIGREMDVTLRMFTMSVVGFTSSSLNEEDEAVLRARIIDYSYRFLTGQMEFFPAGDTPDCNS